MRRSRALIPRTHSYRAQVVGLFAAAFGIQVLVAEAVSEVRSTIQGDLPLSLGRLPGWDGRGLEASQCRHTTNPYPSKHLPSNRFQHMRFLEAVRHDKVTGPTRTKFSLDQWHADAARLCEDARDTNLKTVGEWVYARLDAIRRSH